MILNIIAFFSLIIRIFSRVFVRDFDVCVYILLFFVRDFYIFVQFFLARDLYIFVVFGSLFVYFCNVFLLWFMNILYYFPLVICIIFVAMFFARLTARVRFLYKKFVQMTRKQGNCTDPDTMNQKVHINTVVQAEVADSRPKQTACPNMVRVSGLRIT